MCQNRILDREPCSLSVMSSILMNFMNFKICIRNIENFLLYTHKMALEHSLLENHIFWEYCAHSMEPDEDI